MPAKKAPWKKTNPRPAEMRKTLTQSQKANAKRRARKAGRPYPNLIDNMAVSKKAKTRKAKR